MAEHKRRRPGGRSAENRQKVLDATLAVLIDSGVEGLSVENIARVSGVHKTTIYRRWGGCGTLVTEAIAEQENAIAPIPNTGSLRGDIAALARAYADFFADPSVVAISRLIVAQRGRQQELGQWMDDYWRSRATLYRDILERAVSRGELRDSSATHLTLELLIGPIAMRALLTALPMEEEFLEQLVAAVYGYLLQHR